MDFFFSGLFWGVLLILVGLSVIINLIFHVHIPLMRILFACFLVYLGIRVLLGGRWTPQFQQCDTIIFSDSTVSSTENGEINILFSKGVVDTTTILAERGKSSLKVNTVFAGSTIKIPRSVPIVIKINSAFAGVGLPDGSTTAFGEYTYRNDAARTLPDSVPRKFIELNCVFGGCQVIEN